MRIGIDASNIGGGGGTTHLKEILVNYKHEYFKHDSVVIFASSKVLEVIPNDPLFIKVTFPQLNGSLINRIIFQKTKYDKEIKKRCDILYSVAGDYTGSFKPVVSMSRNMLLYDRGIWKEMKAPKEILRFYLNYLKQKKCFENSSGIIFISNYAKKIVSKTLNLKNKDIVTINHGVSPRFINEVKRNKDVASYTSLNPFRFLYISGVHVYKHQWQVVKAIAILKEQGYNVRLDLIGGVYFKSSLDKLIAAINIADPKGVFIKYHGQVSYDSIHTYYEDTNAIVFASTCENMPNILIESMASGLPIACSDHQPMPEFLKDGGFYFNSYNVNSIVGAMKELMENNKQQIKFSEKNISEIEQFSWDKTSFETFKFIDKIYASYFSKN
ncbi:glycosyltransferase [Winogradskyella thalassocola]|uniref:Glycosyltransferase involved in cell wall bisynthesis n=1 Tax=Winogradskyella thalassocola TaxID=262004 RepID=A0A1G7Z1Z7_9FLAO|nr:glycosyltransferase [Winogradskyella thalassocola]SDH02516.1 Glycosyltransferase involved in cell wall bisynthesis [Winogradskyella thalassocola]